MRKIMNRWRLEVSYCNIIKSIYDKLTAIRILNGKKKLKAFILQSVKGKGHLLSPLLHKTVLEFLERSVSRNQNKVIQIGKQELKLSPFSDTVILYLKDLKGLEKCLNGQEHLLLLWYFGPLSSIHMMWRLTAICNFSKGYPGPSSVLQTTRHTSSTYAYVTFKMFKT